MQVKLIETEGPWLAATIEHGNQRLCVMDAFTDEAGEQSNLKGIFEIELSAFRDQEESWEEIFQGNPNCKKGIEPINGWIYRAFGEIVSIGPVVVDCGILFAEDVVVTKDPQVVGSFIAFTISRLEAHPA